MAERTSTAPETSPEQSTGPTSGWGGFTAAISSAFARGKKTVGAGVDGAAGALGAAYGAVEAAIARAPAAIRRQCAELLQRMASDPEVGRGAVAELLIATPALGAAKVYADAWAAYHRGVSEGNAAMVENARRECVLACLSVAIDAATLTGSLAVKTGGRLGQFVARSPLAHLATRVPKIEAKVIKPVIDAALASPKIRGLVDGILTAVMPLPRAQEGESAPGGG